MQSSFTFELDSETHQVVGEPVDRSLAESLRRRGMGGDDRFRQPDPWLGGAPLLLLDADGRGRPALRSVDAALVPLPAAAGRQFWSAEGLVRRAANGQGHPALAILDLHPELECSWPGRARLLTALIEGYYRHDLQHFGQLSDQLDGCLGRTTNHEALRTVAVELFTDAQSRRHQAEQNARSEGRDDDVRQGRVNIFEDEFSALLADDLPEPEELSYVDAGKRRFHRPQTIVGLARLLAQFPRASLVGGGADLMRTRSSEKAECLISTEGIGDLRALYEHDDRWDIGSAAPLTAVNELLGRHYPEIGKILRRYATRPIRNRATLGGCLAAARAEDSLAPVLIALDAQVRVISLEGERDVPVARFFEGEGKTNLRPSEFVADVVLPRFIDEVRKARECRTRISDVYHSGPRRTAGGGGVTAGFAVELSDSGEITKAWIAYSGLADRPFRLRKTETALAGKPWNEDTVFSVLSSLSQEMQTAPGADASRPGQTAGEREYRQQLVLSLFQKFFYQHPSADGASWELGQLSEFLQPGQPFFPVGTDD